MEGQRVGVGAVLRMNNQKLPWRYRALVAAVYAIFIAGLLLRPFYSKSAVVSLLVIAVFMSAFSGLWAFRTWKQPTRDKLQTAFIAIMLGGTVLGVYVMFVCVRYLMG